MICSRITSRVTCSFLDGVSPGVTPRINSGSRCTTRRRHTRTTRPLGASVHPRTEEKSAAKGEMLRESPPGSLFSSFSTFMDTLALDASLPPGAGAMGYVDIANTPTPDQPWPGMQRVSALSYISFMYHLR